MDTFTFCKKDGAIKKSYIDVCEQITKAAIERHEIMRGRNEEVVDTYDCYTIPRQSLPSKKRDSFESKVCDICKCFDITTKSWYSGWDITIELHGENVSQMISEVSSMLGGDIYIRQAI